MDGEILSWEPEGERVEVEREKFEGWHWYLFGQRRSCEQGCGPAPESDLVEDQKSEHSPRIRNSSQVPWSKKELQCNPKCFSSACSSKLQHPVRHSSIWASLVQVSLVQASQVKKVKTTWIPWKALQIQAIESSNEWIRLQTYCWKWAKGKTERIQSSQFSAWGQYVQKRNWKNLEVGKAANWIQCSMHLWPVATQVGPAISTLNTRETKLMVGQKYLQTSRQLPMEERAEQLVGAPTTQSTRQASESVGSFCPHHGDYKGGSTPHSWPPTPQSHSQFYLISTSELNTLLRVETLWNQSISDKTFITVRNSKYIFL